MPTSGHKITRILANASTDLILNFKGEVETGLNFPISGDEIARITATPERLFLSGITANTRAAIREYVGGNQNGHTMGGLE